MKTSNIPTLSVIMPVYNTALYLAEAIESILNQTFTDYEFICVDDGSTDRSLSILKEYALKDDRFHIISRPNTGIVGALNDGLAVARGKFIARMDGDDLSTPERFTLELAFLNENPDHVAVSSQVLLIDPDGTLIGPTYQPLTHEEIDEALFKGNSSAFIHAAMIVRRDVIQAIGGYREKYKTLEDFDLFLRLIEHGHLANHPQYLYLYRQHLKNTCYTNSQSQQQLKSSVLREACQRHGVPYNSKDIHVHSTPSSDAEIHVGWAIAATNAGNKKTAVKQSLIALKKKSLAIAILEYFFAFNFRAKYDDQAKKTV